MGSFGRATVGIVAVVACVAISGVLGYRMGAGSTEDRVKAATAEVESRVQKAEAATEQMRQEYETRLVEMRQKGIEAVKKANAECSRRIAHARPPAPAAKEAPGKAGKKGKKARRK